MNQVLPDWMFAAFAIGVWELFDQIARHWHIARVRWIGAGFAAGFVAVIVIRYVVRWIQRDRSGTPPNPDEWKEY